MSTSGGNVGGWYRPAAGQWLITPGGSLTNGQLTHQQLLLAPLFLPFPLAVTQAAVGVTTAGGAGATVQPCVYAAAGNGLPGALTAAGPVLAAAAAGTPQAAWATVLPAGWCWTGVLCLAATAPAPIIDAFTDIQPSQYGGPAAVAAAGSAGNLAIQAGLAVLPANFAGALGNGGAPAVWLRL